MADARTQSQAPSEVAGASLLSLIINFLFGGPQDVVRGVVTEAGARGLVASRSSVLGWWQPDPGESYFSARQVLKGLGAVGAYLGYRHVDPYPKSRADNYAALGVLLAALILLGQRKSFAIGTQYSVPEARVIEGAKKLKMKRSVLKAELDSIHGLDPHREARLSELIMAFREDETAAWFLRDETIRAALTKWLGDDVVGETPKPPSAKEELGDAWKQLDQWAGSKGVSAAYQFGSFLRRRGIVDPERRPATPEQEQEAWQEHRREFDRDVDQLRTRRARELAEEV